MSKENIFQRLKGAFSKGNSEENKGQRLNKEEMDAGRMTGPAARIDKGLIDTWKMMLKAQGKNPTERILGIAKYDLEQAAQGQFQKPQQPQQPQAELPGGNIMLESEVIINMSQAMAKQAREFAERISELSSSHADMASALAMKARQIAGLEMQPKKEVKT